MKNLWALRYVFGMLLAFGLVIACGFWAVQNYPVHAGVVLALGALALAIQYWRVRRRDEARGWRLLCVSPDGWRYEEKHAEAWTGFLMSEQMDFREPPHHLEIMSSSRWSEYPEWTHGRREEILARIRSELKEPNYVLKEG